MHNEFDRTYLLDMIENYLSGRATDAEKRFLESYYDFFEAEEKVLASVSSKEKADLKEHMMTAILQEIVEGDAVTKSERPLPERLRYRKASENRKGSVWASVARIAAVLVLGALIGMYLLVDNPGNLLRSPDRIVAAKVMDGQTRDIFLADGSIVTLNDGSTLKYPAEFSDHAREVYLTGEGYFDIKHDSEKPFVVRSGKIRVHVLGTAFNVKAKPGEADIEVTVARGKVRVSEVDKELGTITADQQISYNSTTGAFLQTDLKAVRVTDWKPVKYTMDNVTLAEAARIIEKRFDKDVVLRGENMPEYNFTASFYEHDPLTELLSVICEITDTEYQIKGDKVMIRIRDGTR